MEYTRKSEIYKITNSVNGKMYVGQTVAEILNHNAYRPFGMHKRFKQHVCEANRKNKYECTYLNNAIRKYGADAFTVELIETCLFENADERETYYIINLNTIYPNGYNLKIGGKTFRHSDESKKRLSIGVAKYFEDKKHERFKDITCIDDNIENHIKPLIRNNSQYGWYVYIQRKKADFGGIHIPLDISKNNAIEFITYLKHNLAKHLDAGNP